MAGSPSIAAKRLMTEFNLMKRDPSPSAHAAPLPSNIFEWEGWIMGPANTPYEGGKFHMKWRFPNNYPMSPPQVTFQNKIYHPNINTNGDVCVDVLKSLWRPAHRISTILTALQSLLSEPNPESPLMPSIAELFVSDRMEYDKRAREWTAFYAKESKTDP